MASEEGDANTLKRRVVELLLQNPQGIGFEDFSGAFHQLHGYHPRIALHGYNTLKKLAADMENAVVVQRNSHQQVMKIAKGFRLERWLKGEKEKELQTSKGEVENLKSGEDQVRDGRILTDVLDWLISLLMEYKSGLRMSYIEKFMLSKHDVNMEKFSIARGYRNVVEFLEHELPDLIIRYREKSCEYVVQIPEASSLYSTWKSDPNHVKEPTKHLLDFLAASKLIQGVLKQFPCGIKVTKLKSILKKRCKFDFTTFRTQQGYPDVLSCLKDIPELLLLNTNKLRNCVVRLQPRPFGSDLSLDSDFSGCSSHSEPRGQTTTHSVRSLEGTSSFTPLDTSFSVGHINAQPEKPTATKSAVSLPSTSVSVPNHVKEPTNQALALPEVLALVNNILTMYVSGLRIHKLQEILMTTNSFDLEKFSISQGYKDSLEFLQRQMNHVSYFKRKERCNCVIKLGKKTIKAKKKQSQTHPQNGTAEKNPSVASVPSVMNAPMPPSTKPVEPAYSQSVLSAESTSSSTTSLDTSFSAGHTNAQPEKPMATNSGAGNVPKPSVTPHDFSASKSQSQSLSFLDSSVPQEIKDMIHSSTHIQLPSFHEVRSASPAKPKNPCQSVSNGPRQKLNVCQVDGPPPPEEVPCQLNRQLSSKSNMTKEEPSKDQDDLKQQVAHILAMHPEGMSLFQFRAAYSAAYQRHFPMGNAASAKQRLQEMPDVVCMKSFGAQTRLVPVSSAMSPPKSGLPVSSTMKKTSVVPGLSQHRTVSLTQENSEELGDDNKEDYPFLTPLLQQVAKPRAPVQEEVKKNPKPMRTPVIPQSPVVCHTYAQVTASCKPLKPNSLHSKPMHLNSPCVSASSVSVSSHPNDPCISSSRASVPSHPNDPCFSASSVSVSSHPNDPCISSSRASVPSHPNDPCFSASSVSVSSHPNDPFISSNRASVPSHPNNSCISPNRASVPLHPNDPCISANSSSVPFTSHPASYNFGTWAQPVPFVPQMPFVSQMPGISPVKPAYTQVSRYPSRIQFQNPTVQSSPFGQPPHVLPINCHPTMFLTQSAEQWTNIHTLPQVAAYSRVQTSSNVLQIAPNPTVPTGIYPVSPSSRNMPQSVQQLECYKHTQQDGLQRSSVVVTKKSFTVTSLGTEPKPSASPNQRQYVDWNPLVSTTDTAPFISHGCWSTSQSFQTLETSSSSKSNPSALLFEPPVFEDQQLSVSASATITTSSYSPPSLVDATVSPYNKHLFLSNSSKNSAAQPSEPRASINQQQYAKPNTSVITSSRKQAGSSPCPQDLPIRSSHQLSITPLSVCTDNELPAQANPVVSFSKHDDHHHVSLPKAQTSYSPPNSPLKKPDRCVIL
ncbi:mucin-5AC-like isoform X2 [Anolis sagrei]|uniref:mucin-5AC-like isoform X2 n=1 Tax=Anolis sagrei TaxID=38937 RepID=UPI003520FD81